MEPVNELEQRWRDLGEFIREQRRVGHLSLRKLSEMAGISNPYLSQIERGLRKPSAEILQQIARALEISSETLYIRAGILEERPDDSDLASEIRRDPWLDEEQKRTLIRIYESFRAAQAPAGGLEGIRRRLTALPLLVRSLAVLSLHSSPLAQPGTGDSGGMNVYVRELVSALAQAGVDCRAYVRRWRDDLPDEVAVEPGFRVVHVSAGPRDLPKEELPAVVDTWTEGVLDHITATGGIDAIHANYWLSGLAGHAIKHRLDLPLVSTFHTLARVKADTGDAEPQRRIDAESEVIACSDAILASCSAEAAQLEQFYGARPERIEIVPPGVDHAFFSPGDQRGARTALDLPADRPVLLFVGRIQPLKGLDVAVAALAALPDQDAVLVAVGGPSGPSGEVELARVHELARRARRRGPGPVRAAPAAPPAVDLLPGRRRLRRAEPVGVLRPRRPRGRGLRHARRGRRGGRARHHRRGRHHRAARSRGATRPPSPTRSPACSADPGPAPGDGGRRPPPVPAATRGPPRRPACAASTPTSPSANWSTAPETSRVGAPGSAYARRLRAASSGRVRSGDGSAGDRAGARRDRGADRRLAGRAAGHQPGGRRHRPRRGR